MPGALIICVGNTMRGDDGAAHRVAELLTERGCSNAVTVVAQLDVAMAADVADRDLVVIVDAERRESPPVHVSEVGAGPGASMGHSLDPEGLLGLSLTLYGHAPRCLLVSVAAPAMSHGEGLSRTAMAACEQAAIEVERLVQGPL
jgi:hydrogenase maturation protease